MPTGDDLHDAMAQAARAPQDTDDIDDLLELAVGLAVRDVDHADGATVTIARRRGAAFTAAASHESARRADELQYAAGEGPCLSAVWDAPLIRVEDVEAEERWPAWVADMRDRSGFRSMLVLRLFTAQDRLGALNLYAVGPGAFDPVDVDHGEVLAAHIAVALRSAQEISGLNIALDGRTVVGQAQGILMERFGLEPAAAFGVLTRVSSHSNRKLRDIAQELVDTRVVPGDRLTEPDDEALG
jgi:hypothetical protein